MAISLSHEDRVQTLEVIASLAGFTEVLKALPDGSRPDVLRTSALSGRLFLGEAKEAERPSDRGVRQRMAGYMRWFEGGAALRGPGGIFALCVSCLADVSDWALMLEELAEEARLTDVRVAARLIDADTAIVWLYKIEGLRPR